MEGTDPGRERTSRWAERSAELDARIRDLHERNAQLSASSGPPDLEERRTAGSTPGQAAKAKAQAEMAHVRAIEAMKRTATLRVHAAGAHERAARLHELLADAGQGDVQDHRDRAAAHWQQALDDRAGAARMFGSQPAAPPKPGA